MLFISLGTIFTNHPKFYRTCIEAFGDGSWQVAMTVGEVDTAALGPLPSTVDIRPRFPQLAVLRHAAAFVSHSGMNSTMEALYHGVPLITFPQVPEQVANTVRIQELGLGERLDAGTVTAEELRAAVTRIASNPRVHANLDRMRKVQRAVLAGEVVGIQPHQLGAGRDRPGDARLSACPVVIRLRHDSHGPLDDPISSCRRPIRTPQSSRRAKSNLEGGHRCPASSASPPQSGPSAGAGTPSA